ncbi:baseplate assembly protein [Desulfocurvibacter africanus]|uniref:Baseplate J family protein n=1 Tax=Desulfocurvibacter africanus subsp. africanus str. Walvis Bay TaxID=690850 RepID=F3YY52_DESAF|nr:baseplate J/gp47 family protein [Desulfocurvibacter africanus]EGJ51828.1 Baseplate J family protein [Desulfocurvibacter africanus subsp. africanus str. Walvis Bay]
MNLTNLPEVSFCETDAAKVRDAILLTHQGLTGRSLAPGAPERLFLEALAAIISQQRVIIDDTGRQGLLAYARGAALDHKGAPFVARLPASRAVVRLQFSMPTSQSFAVRIPKGTRATPDGLLMFATREAKDIPIGQKAVEVDAECLEAGSKGNGYVAGQIARLVDPLTWVTAVTNTTESSDGCDEEDDERLRERIALAPESFSVAGPEGAYVFWAKSASALIADVAVLSPSDGRVEVYPLLSGGQVPSPSFCADVAKVLTNKQVRPLTDHVSVLPPSQVQYAIELTYWLRKEDALAEEAIHAAVAKAVDDYILWQRGRLGRDIDPSELVYRVKAAGAKRCQVTSPAYTSLAPSELAVVPGADHVHVAWGDPEDE